MGSPLPGYDEENSYIHSRQIQSIVGGKRPRAFGTDSLRSELRKYSRDNAQWIRWILEYFASADMRRSLHAVRDVQDNSPALVMGNGPSTAGLNSSDVNIFIDRGGHLFTVNHVFEHAVLDCRRIFCHTLSDPESMDQLANPSSGMHAFLTQTAIDYLYVPDGHKRQYSKMLPDLNVLPFCDREIRTRVWKRSSSIRPDRPRSYLSLTVYKALALAIWMGHNPIYIVGFDNTYVRDLYCGPSNEIILRQRHFYGESLPGNYSQLYASVGDLVYELSLAFSDLHKFARASVLNLDPFSLTDAFPKSKTILESKSLLRGTRE